MTDLNLITPNSNLTLNLDEQAALDFSNNLQQAQLPIVPPVGLPRIPGLNPDGSFGSNPLELLEGPADVLLNILRTTGTVLGNSASPILATRSGIALPREVLDLLPQPVRAIFANNQGVAGALILPPDTEARLLREGAGALPGIFRETTIWLAANPVGGTLGGTPVIGGGAAVVTINFKNGFDRPEVSFGQGFGYNFNVGGRFGLTPTGPNSDIWTFLNRRVSANEIAELFGSGIALLTASLLHRRQDKQILTGFPVHITIKTAILFASIWVKMHLQSW
ncbi:MAG: hypothetical protein HC850_01180 [Rhodomicrobium sp.]|nr:hypothetical protein [Rhodomicrobium sp.]